MKWPLPAKRGQTNYHFADRYSIYHAMVGGALRLADASLPTAVAVSLAWETAEPYLKGTLPKVFPASTADTPANKIGDMVFFLAGWSAVNQLKKRKKPRRKS